MEILRYRPSGGGQPRLGAVERGVVREAQGDLYGKLVLGREVGPLEQIELLPPVMPSKLLAIGLNYQDHISQDAPGFQTPEVPITFLKPPSALVGHNQPIVYPTGVERLDAEAELAIVIGKHCRHV